MKLPNGERARIDVRRKLLGYCLNLAHPTGKHKARVFEAVLGIHAGNVRVLVDALRQAARDADAQLRNRSEDAAKYQIESPVTGPRGTAIVRSGWIIERGSDVPRLVTCFVRPRARGVSRGTRT